MGPMAGSVEFAFEGGKVFIRGRGEEGGVIAARRLHVFAEDAANIHAGLRRGGTEKRRK